MIKYFRKIRQKLFTENMFSKYLLYAIGEVVLVVIGIMIALYFNNLNQERIQGENLKATLVEIQRDIARDIDFTNNYIRRFKVRDSRKNLIFNNKVTNHDIKSGRIDMYRAAFIRDPIRIQRNAFEKFKNEIDDISVEYDELVSMLDQQYNMSGKYLEELNISFKYDQNKNKDYLYSHLDWFAQDEFDDVISDEQIDFYLNDPEYKNLVMRMSQRSKSVILGVIAYRVQALKTYFKIKELLGDKGSIDPKEIRETTLSDAGQADSIIGIYKLISGSPKTSFGTEFEITSMGKQLYLVQQNSDPLLLYYWDSENLEFFPFQGSSILVLSSKTPDKITIINGDSDNTIWEKHVNQD